MFFPEAVLGDDPNTGVGLADEVVALGLFANHSGKERNEPIVRFGNIAMLPREPVVTNATLGPMDLYLVELRSIAGMSGSPVFVPHRVPIGAGRRPMSLFGVMLGHYPVQPADIVGAAVNSGIGMVAPARKLGEILFSKELIEMRKRAREEWEADKANAEMDSLKPTDQPSTFTKDEFERALRKVTRRVEPPEREPE